MLFAYLPPSRYLTGWLRTDTRTQKCPLPLETQSPLPKKLATGTRESAPTLAGRLLESLDVSALILVSRTSRRSFSLAKHRSSPA